MAETNATQSETFPVGIVGVGLTKEQRQIPAGDPPPLAPNAELSSVVVELRAPYPNAEFS